MSLVIVVRFVFQAMCANVMTQINASARADDGVNAITTLNGITSAQGSIAAARALRTVQLRLIKYPDARPPLSEPRSAERYGSQASIPISTIVNPRCSTRYFGIQNR